MIFIIKLIY